MRRPGNTPACPPAYPWKAPVCPRRRERAEVVGVLIKDGVKEASFRTRRAAPGGRMGTMDDGRRERLTGGAIRVGSSGRSAPATPAAGGAGHEWPHYPARA